MFLLSKELINDYLDNAEEKIKVAELLFENGYYKDCISRTYYSMYWAAKALLIFKGLNVKTHKGLITRFGLDFVKKGFVEKVYGKALRIAKEEREAADYEIDINYSCEDASQSIQKAKDFLTKIKETLKILKKNNEKS